MNPIEMADRVRHDLIKHLDIPHVGEVLSIERGQALLRRLFDSGTGLCQMARVWGFKLRHDAQWDVSLEPALQRIEEKAGEIARNEAAFRKQVRMGGALSGADIGRLDGICAAVSEFEKACRGIDGTGGNDGLAMLDFFGIVPSAPDEAAGSVHKTCASKLRVLVVDDHLMLIDRLQSHAAFMRRFCWATLCHESCECVVCPHGDGCPRRRARTAREALQAFEIAREKGQAIDAVLMDVRFDDLAREELISLPGCSGGEDLEKIRALQGLIIAQMLRRTPGVAENIPIMLMTARSRIPDGAKSLLKDMEGLQFVDDDDSLDTLASRIESLVRMNREGQEDGGYFWGRSPRILSVRRQIEIMSQGPRTMLITGPSGVGKSSLVERIIAPMSRRKPLITLDLSSIPGTLVESELFGHVKGAYSGAVGDKMGLIEEADGGVLFLDEIGNLSLEIQSKLLLFLQDKVVRRIGAAHRTSKKVDVKVIVATHIDLEQEIKAGRFRFDLYMRFSPAMKIALPALCERREDLPSFVEMLLQRIVHSDDMKPLFDDFMARSKTDGAVRVDFFKNPDALLPGQACIRFKAATRELFMAYGWPGNTRELESVLDTLILKALYDLKVASAVTRIIEIDPYYALSLLGGIERGEASSRGLPQEACGGGMAAWTGDGQVYADFSELRRALETRCLSECYAACGGDIGMVAQKLFGDDSAAVRHKIVVRMNQLGIRLRSLKKGLG